MCIVVDMTIFTTVTIDVFFLKSLSSSSWGDLCFEVARHQYPTSIGSRESTRSQTAIR